MYGYLPRLAPSPLGTSRDTLSEIEFLQTVPVAPVLDLNATPVDIDSPVMQIRIPRVFFSSNIPDALNLFFEMLALTPADLL
jgi:hypothetical protein